MYIISGRTFDIRNILKGMGATYDGDTKTWRVHPTMNVETLRQMPGIIVTDDGKAPGAGEHISRIEHTPQVAVAPALDGMTHVYGDDTSNRDIFSIANPTAFYGFSNLEAMTRFVETMPASIRHAGDRRGRAWEREPVFFGTDDMIDAIQIAREGWTDGVTKAKDVLELLEAQQALKLRHRYAVAGGGVSVGRLLASNPMHMKRRERMPAKNTIRLIVNTVSTAMIETETQIVRAACVAAVVDILENSGYSCEIVAVSTNKHPNDNALTMQTATQLKHAGETLNLQDIVFALGHPSYLRRFIFACAAFDDRLVKLCRRSYGIRNDEDIDIDNTGDFIIGSMHENSSDPHEILNTIIPDNLPITIKGRD